MSQKTTITIDHAGTVHAEPADAQTGLRTGRVSAFDLVASTPWAIEPQMLETIRTISMREGDGVEALQAKMGSPLINARNVSVRDGVAIVPITGPIFRYANLFTQISGATSLDVLSKDLTAALEDPKIKGVILEINSPGGQVTGIAEFAAMVHTANKPVVSYVGGMAASAAYWIASASKRIVMSKSAMAGNVGAVLGLSNKSDPHNVEIVSSQSPNKRPNISTDAGLALIQTMVDAHAQVFIEDVATYRGMTPDAVVKDFNGGDMYIASKAVATGMADSIGTIEQLISELSGSNPASTNALNLRGETFMSITLQQVLADAPDVAEALRAEGAAAGATAAAVAERERIQSVFAQAMPGHDALIQSLAFDGKTSGPEAAVAVLGAEKKLRATALADRRADAPEPAAYAAAPVDKTDAAADASLPVEERCKAQWDKDAKLRAEFGTLDSYAAYTRGLESGRVRVLGATAA